MVNYNIYYTDTVVDASFVLKGLSTLLFSTWLLGVQQYITAAATRQQAPTAIPTANISK